MAAGSRRRAADDSVPGAADLHPAILECARQSLFLLMALACAPAAGQVAAPAPRLHVPSPDWRDQIVYFVVTDRFDDGDPRNDDQGAGEYDPADGAKYSGGDLAGITRRLDYIQGLGATAVWITPPVANQWWNPRARYGGYHGYWATDFTRLDPHVGTLADYRRLSTALHARGMYLVQDIVVNHTADFFHYDASRDPADPARGFRRERDAQGQLAPARAPFSLNDARDPAQRAAHAYHWTPDIVDFSDPVQLLTGQLAGLDDLDTENPVVRTALRAAYGDWIREAGVDAFRVDTAFYVPPAFFRDFLQSPDPRHPGILKVAQATGRQAFHVFGEGFGIDRPYEDVQSRRIDAYMRDAAGPLLPGMLAFPLYGTANDVFARGHPTAELGWRIEHMLRAHASPWLMPTFLDNHDVDRFLAGGDRAGLAQGLLMLMTLPGIPVVYYGTEQGFTGQRDAMFARGAGSGGRDHFDTQAPLYRYVQRVTALRRGHRVFSRGTPRVLRASAAGPGPLAYATRDGEDVALVAFNTATGATLLDNMETGLAPGTVLRGQFAIDGECPDLVVGSDGTVSLPMPPRAGYAWIATPERRVLPAPRAALHLAPITPTPHAGDVPLEGRAQGVESLRIVVDGDLVHATRVHPDRDGRWRARVDTGAMVDPAVAHDVVAWDEASGTASPRRTFRVARAWRLLSEVEDPLGDDAGPTGRYRYPTDAGYAAHPGDITRVRVLGAGGALRIELQMRAITTPWNPPNGFDHVAFTVFIEMPGRGAGARAMPQQHAQLPQDMRWHYRLRAHGWSNALFKAEGADAAREGTAATPAASLGVDAGTRTIVFTLPASALGRPPSLAGVRVYATTWDFDGGYRALAPTAGPHAFGGGGGEDPRVMDDTAVIALP